MSQQRAGAPTPIRTGMGGGEEALGGAVAGTSREEICLREDASKVTQTRRKQKPELFPHPCA